MHGEALAFIRQYATTEPVTVLEFGSRDINGSPRALFPYANYLGIDIAPGPGVDLVGDATYGRWSFGTQWDYVLCVEVLEHVEPWRAIVANARYHLKPGGQFIATMATTGRPPHSQVDGGVPKRGEHYENIRPLDLIDTLDRLHFDQPHIEVHESRGDLYCHALAPAPDRFARPILEGLELK